MARPMGNKYGNFLETSQEVRLFSRAKLLESCEADALPTGPHHFPWMIPDAWFEEPDPPLRRELRIIDKYDLFVKSEMNYALCLMLISNRLPACSIFDNRSNLPPLEEIPDEEKTADDQEFRINFRRFKERAAELDKSLKSAEIIGLDSDGGADGGFKILVFQTAKIDDEILRLFLTTCELPELSTRTEPVTPLEKHRRPHSYLFVENSTKPLQSYTMPTTQEMIGSLPASSFIEKSITDVFLDWESIIKPVTECRSLIATHCFVILDAWTAEGSNTVVVVTPYIENHEGRYDDFYTYRRVTFTALGKGLLKGLEMLMVDLRMLEVVDDSVVLGRAWGWDPADEEIGGADEQEEDIQIENEAQEDGMEQEIEEQETVDNHGNAGAEDTI